MNHDAHILCPDLEPSEQEKVTRLGPAIVRRFAVDRREVRVCTPVGEGPGRLFCFLDAAGKNLGSVRAADLMDAPEHTAPELISSWNR